MMKKISELRPFFPYWTIIADLIDQSIDVMLNLRQSGHPGGSRSKVHALVATLLSGAMRWDIRNPGKRFGDRFILVSGHTNPAVYATLAVFNEALRRKYQQTGNKKYKNPMGDEYTLHWEDLLTLRHNKGLPGHAEMEGKTLFFKFNTGPSGHGSPPAAGQAFSLKYAGCSDVKVFAFEGEGGLTTGVTHETKNSAFGLGLGNLIYVIDWNDYGIDNRPFSEIIAGNPVSWFEPYGWKVRGTENGEDWESITSEFYQLLSDNNDSDTPKILWIKNRKGRGYGKYDNASHGSPHKRNSKEFWKNRHVFAKQYDLKFKYIDKPECDFETCKEQTKDFFNTMFTIFDSQPDILNYLADVLINLGESIPNKIPDVISFTKNPLNDPFLFNVEKYPDSLFVKPGEMVPNRAGFAKFGSWINSYTLEKYGRPLIITCSADLADSTNISGFSKGWDGYPDTGMYNRLTNTKGTLLPQGITEFANAGIMVGVASVNFSNKPFEEFNGFLSASSTYGSFSYLKYGEFRLFSQMAQDSQLKVGKTIWVAGHSGPETAEDSRTHFGIFATGITQMFPEGQIINLHPWEHNEVAPMLAAALNTDIPIIVIHLTRPPIEIPDREVLGLPSHFNSAKGAYIIKDYDCNRPLEGLLMVRGTSVISELMKILSKIITEGPNIKIVATLSWELFNRQKINYKSKIINDREWLDAMIITNTSFSQMYHWVHHPIVRKYSISSDWDNRWRTGGSLEEIIDEAHLSANYQWEAILRFGNKRKERLENINKTLPEVEILPKIK